MIIIEGTDGVGKTTVAKKIEAETGLLYRHLSRLPDSFHRYHGYLPLMHENFVCDRLYLSELAYSYARNDSNEMCKLTAEYVHLLEAHLRLLGCVQVVITADNDLLEKRFVKDEMYNLQTIVRANNWFQEYHSTSVDFKFHLTENEPWLEKNSLSQIMLLHKKKQTFLTALFANNMD